MMVGCVAMSPPQTPLCSGPLWERVGWSCLNILQLDFKKANANLKG